jgi:hypothetical protein
MPGPTYIDLCCELSSESLSSKHFIWMNVRITNLSLSQQKWSLGEKGSSPEKEREDFVCKSFLCRSKL